MVVLNAQPSSDVCTVRDERGVLQRDDGANHACAASEDRPVPSECTIRKRDVRIQSLETSTGDLGEVLYKRAPLGGQAAVGATDTAASMLCQVAFEEASIQLHIAVFGVDPSANIGDVVTELATAQLWITGGAVQAASTLKPGVFSRGVVFEDTVLQDRITKAVESSTVTNA